MSKRNQVHPAQVWAKYGHRLAKLVRYHCDAEYWMLRDYCQGDAQLDSASVRGCIEERIRKYRGGYDFAKGRALPLLELALVALAEFNAAEPQSTVKGRG